MFEREPVLFRNIGAECYMVQFIAIPGGFAIFRPFVVVRWHDSNIQSYFFERAR